MTKQVFPKDRAMGWVMEQASRLCVARPNTVGRFVLGPLHDPIVWKLTGTHASGVTWLDSGYANPDAGMRPATFPDGIAFRTNYDRLQKQALAERGVPAAAFAAGSAVLATVLPRDLHMDVHTWDGEGFVTGTARVGRDPLRVAFGVLSSEGETFIAAQTGTELIPSASRIAVHDLVNHYPNAVHL